MSHRHRGSRHHKAISGRASFRLRRRILIRDGYRCRSCGRPGRLEVDHVVPMDRGGAALDPANLQALCTPCHIQKTMRERGGPVDPEREAWRQWLFRAQSTEKPQ